MNEQGQFVGLITYRDIMKTKERPLACKDSKGRLCVAAGVGITPDMMDRVDALVKAGADAIVIDTAHGHSIRVVEALKTVKNKYPNLDVVVGNIATGEAAIMLAEAGADAIKVGIGPGSICSTRIIAGIGVPQLTAVCECVGALKSKGYDVPIIADGGIRYSGDVVKALLLAQAPSWSALSWLAPKRLPARPSSTKAVSSSRTAAWAPSKPCSAAPRTATSRTRRWMPRNSCPKAWWDVCLTKAPSARCSISSSAA